MEKIVTEKEELINEEQYLKEERKGIRELEDKYEFHLGEKIFIGGAAKEHNAISTNLTVLIGSFIMDKAYQHYLAVSYTSQMIEHYQKLNDSEWKLKIIKDEEDKLEILKGLSLSMKDIYCNVKFAEKD